MLENLMQNNQFHTKHASRNYHIASWVINYSKPHPAWRYPYPSNPISPLHSTTVLDLSVDYLLLCVFTPHCLVGHPFSRLDSGGSPA